MKNNGHQFMNSLINMGAYVSHTIEGNALIIITQQGTLMLTVYNDELIRIQAVFTGQKFDEFSYAVIYEPTPTHFICDNSEAHIILKTTKTIIEISKSNSTIRFLNSNNEILNEDDSFFGISNEERHITCYKKLQEGERFIGLGEKTGNLDRRGAHYTHWNTDAFAYGVEADPLYISTPFYIGIHHHLCYGIFLDNTYKTEFDFGASNNRFSSFSAQGGVINYYFINGNTIPDIIENYTLLTGRMSLPPKWALGFQQCRYSYYPDFEVLNLAKNFRTRDIPADVIYLDIHYMQDYKAFTWDKNRFPHPKQMLTELKAMGFHVVLIVDPGVKVDADYDIYTSGLKHHYFICYPDGIPYSGNVWPGQCHLPDYTKPDVRKWWGQHYKKHLSEGVSGFWNDMNEPSVWGKHIPNLVRFDYDGHSANHLKAHNIYGLQMARSTYEGLLELEQDKRPFVLSRSGYSGIQRYAALWTGDNISTDEHMLAGVRLINSMGLTGMAFCGYDVGGFAGEATPDLFARWIALGAFSPFFRAHSMINSRDAEPWSFGEETEEIARYYIKLRYRLLPYLYSCFYEASQTGIPIQRSLSIDYTFDPIIYKSLFQNQYLFGPSLLVCPVESYKSFFKVYLPEGQWYDLYTDKLYNGSSEYIIECHKKLLPVFVKEGSIIPMQSDVEHTSQKPLDNTLFIHIYAGSSYSSFNYYEDDGVSYDFKKGYYYQREIELIDENKIHFGKAEGTYDTQFKRLRIYFHGFENLNPVINGMNILLDYIEFRFIQPISQFDPWQNNNADNITINNLPFLETEWKGDSFTVFLHP